MEKSLKIEKTLRDIEKPSEDDRRTEVLAEGYDMEIELLKSTRDNFLVWKDYDY